MKRESTLIVMFLVVFVLIMIPIASAGFFDRFTGKLTDTPIDLNITVTSGSVPSIYYVINVTDVSNGPNEGPAPTPMIINFSVSDTDGFGNINMTSATINITNGGSDRENLTCANYWTSGNLANFTCNVTMWWFDPTSDWTIYAYIKDVNGNKGNNNSEVFYLGTTAGFEASPSSLNFGDIAPGATTEQATNDPMELNNTGNLVRNLEINATNLYGESTPAYAIGAANFSVNTADTCAGTSMVAQTFTAVGGGSTLPIGNYTLNEGTAQEDLYYCIDETNADLTAQYYSTDAAGAWTIKIVT